MLRNTIIDIVIILGYDSILQSEFGNNRICKQGESKYFLLLVKRVQRKEIANSRAFIICRCAKLIFYHTIPHYRAACGQECVEL